MLLKKICIFIMLISSALLLGGCTNEKDSDKLNIITTVFPSYDFVREITNEEANIELLLKPGTDFHSFDPTPQDIINIQESDLFIYVGSENWVETILNSIDTNDMKIIRLMDYIHLEEELIVEGMEHSHDDHDHEEDEHNHEEDEHDHDHEEHEIDNNDLSYNDLLGYDEHIWTSLKNSIILIDEIKNAIIEIDEDNKNLYEANSNSYKEKLITLDEEIEIMINSSERNEIVVGDKFPFTYFALDYDLEINAAFTGCSTASEASAQTITYLINKVEDTNIPVVFYIELSNQKVADAIIEETDVEKLELHSTHNLTLTDFENGVSYLDLMTQNYNNLKKALN